MIRFVKKSTMAKEIPASNQGISHNSLAFGSVIKGEIITDSDIRIDGTVEGDIQSKGKVIIGPKGKIIGDVICSTAEILGYLEGNLKVSDTLTLQSTGNIQGNITTEVLIIEPNAIFCGSCTMGNKKSAENKNTHPKKSNKK